MKNASIRALVIALIVSTLPACSLLGSSLDRAAKAGGKLVTFYCTNVTLPEARQQIRDAVNHYAAPNSIIVTCANGTPALNSASGNAQ